MKLTQASKLTDFQGTRSWYILDAKEAVLGKLATKAANLLRGKEKPSFSPHVDCGDNVIVINAKDIQLTGNKVNLKMYRRHSGYLGNLKESRAKEVLQKNPKRIVEEAILGMLPKNKLKKHFAGKLYIYETAEHKHDGQNPTPVSVN